MPPKRRGETSGAEPTKRRRWTPDEENELRTLVGELGPDVARRRAAPRHWPLGDRRRAALEDNAARRVGARRAAAAPKPAKRARKSAAKRAARSAAKPVATAATRWRRCRVGRRPRRRPRRAAGREETAVEAGAAARASPFASTPATPRRRRPRSRPRPAPTAGRAARLRRPTWT